MCGIAGQVNACGAYVDSGQLIAAINALEPRGPDGSGVWTERGVGLAHRRLAIIDTSDASAQPMHSSCGRFVMTYNGEVYNFRELREQIAAVRPWQWRSEGDTETVLAAYVTWGAACLQLLRGMFAFAIWDRESRQLFLARDRLGVKPLYYYAAGGRLLFASRPRAIVVQTERSLPLDPAALRLYLDCGFIPSPLSYSTGLAKLQPGHYLEWSECTLRVSRYWQVPHFDVDTRELDEADLLDLLQQRIEDSVRLRLVSDVPVGVFLSGGIDSAVVAAVMSRTACGPIRSFTIGFREPEFDESAAARAVASHLGTRHHEDILSVQDLLGLVPAFVAAFDEPFADSSAIPMLALARLTRREVKVALSGDGGDELFGGYHYYRILAGLQRAYSVPQPIRRVTGAAIRLLPSHASALLSSAIAQPDWIAGFAFMRSIRKDFGSVLLPDAEAAGIGIEKLYRDRLGGERPMDPVAGASYIDCGITLPDDYLQKVDVASMSFSVEAREPLLDHELVEWSMRLPTEWKLRGGTLKYLLRKLAYRFVPRGLLQGPKRGFRVPLDQWFRYELRDWARERIEARELYARVPLDIDAVRRLFNLHLSGRRNVAPLIWAVLVLLEFVSRERPS
jgi:asparagine synthase (glutamine-hydrolysing)